MDSNKRILIRPYFVIYTQSNYQKKKKKKNYQNIWKTYQICDCRLQIVYRGLKSKSVDSTFLQNFERDCCWGVTLAPIIL